ncbi:hypothetical protein AB434_1556 [Heyndrickxia coagulans]|uniref:Uncharacterized protein n=1 Tax=Heyndrickxia coagulans TaxID=1398 RepID=A0AAN0WDJ4_HEYCO|nr:hypothetical protein SB48_HM08orf06022 [Heyndrickxia coagulans]AKN53961.1 hypothetical protein AB434_1556 [Heyndrickxia coagulans]KYC91355.1 hypothetical protein B4096_0992 [Heyndrickxia coagulans]
MIIFWMMFRYMANIIEDDSIKSIFEDLLKPFQIKNSESTYS